MSKLITSETYSASKLSNSCSSVNVHLYDESQLLNLHLAQKNRELFVASCLENYHSPVHSKNEFRDYQMDACSSQEQRIQNLKKQIKAIKKERKQVLQNGLKTVQGYMDQLKYEHEEYAQQMQQLRNEIDQIKEQFLAEVSKIESSLHANSKDVEEIIKHVRKIVEESELLEGESISRIHVKEIGDHRTSRSPSHN